MLTKLVNIWHKPWLNVVSRLALTSVLLSLLFTQVDLGETLSTLRTVKIEPLLLAFAIYYLIRYIGAYQMSLGLSSLDMRVSVFQLFKIRLISGFYSLILPGDLVAGSIGWYKLSRSSRRSIESGALLIYFRLINTLMLLGLGWLALWLDPRMGSARFRWIVALMFLMIVSMLLPFFSKRISDFIRRFANFISDSILIPEWIEEKGNAAMAAVTAFQGISRGRILTVLFLAVISQALQTMNFYLYAVAVDIRLPISVLSWIRSFVTIVQMVPISISGLGVREVSLVMLLKGYSIPESQALSFSLTMFAGMVVTKILGGFFEIRSLLRAEPTRDHIHTGEKEEG